MRGKGIWDAAEKGSRTGDTRSANLTRWECWMRPRVSPERLCDIEAAEHAGADAAEARGCLKETQLSPIIRQPCRGRVLIVKSTWSADSVRLPP